MTAKDPDGRSILGQTVTLREPQAGGSVVLTIDVDLQGDTFIDACP